MADVNHDPNRRRHARHQQKIQIGRTDDSIIGRGVLKRPRRWTDVRHLSGEGMFRKSLDRECGLVAGLA
jgi:hypothetical protein